jgi:hypothetical protein
MKKLFAALAAGVVLLALSACGTTAPAATQTTAQLLSTLQVKAQKVCTVGVPFLASMTAMKSQLSTDAQGYLATASDKVNAACTALASSSTTPFSTADVTALVNEGVPALIKVIDASNWTKDQKSAAEIALTAAQLAVSTALADYLAPAPTAAPDAASGAVAS